MGDDQTQHLIFSHVFVFKGVQDYLPPTTDNYCRFLGRINLELATELAVTRGNNPSDEYGFFAGRSLPEIHYGSVRLLRAAIHN